MANSKHQKSEGEPVLTAAENFDVHLGLDQKVLDGDIVQSVQIKVIPHGLRPAELIKKWKIRNAHTDILGHESILDE